MPDTKTIAVVGATGAQGGGLTRAILEWGSNEFAARALTRKPDSDKAQRLAERGAEVVAADLDDLDSLEEAFRGAHGAYCVTNFWEHFSPDKELKQARNMAEAAHTAGVRHLVWSTLEDTRKLVALGDDSMPTLQEKYKVPHYDAKGEANKYFAEVGVPTTYFLTSFYWDNMIFFGLGPKETSEGKLALTLAMNDKKLPGIAAEDIGKCALGVFREGKTLIGQTMGIAGQFLTGSEMASGLSRALGQQVDYNAISPEAFRNLGFPGADDLGNMFQFKRDFNDAYCGARSIEHSRQLNPELQTFDQWLEANKHRIPVQ